MCPAMIEDCVIQGYGYKTALCWASNTIVMYIALLRDAEHMLLHKQTAWNMTGRRLHVYF